MASPPEPLGPPAHLNESQVAYLKTALALVVIKRRWEQRQAQQQATSPTTKHDPTTRPALDLCPLDAPPQESLPSDHHHHHQDWAHLDHMMQVTLTLIVQDNNNNKAERLEAVCTHIAAQLGVVPLVEQWMYSYFVVLSPDSCQIWQNIVQRLLGNTTVIDLVLAQLSNVLLSELGSHAADNNDEHPHYFSLLNLFSQVLSVASREALEQCLEALSAFNQHPVDLQHNHGTGDSEKMLLRLAVSTVLQNLATSLSNAREEEEDGDEEA